MSTHLILVCCHAVYTGGPTKGIDEKEWLIAPFMKGEIPVFRQHCKEALSLLCCNPAPDSIIVFSGGPTRREVPLSEAASYLALCCDNDFWKMLPEERKDSILLEEHALDSFSNLVLGVVRYWKEVGTWPERITIISQGFKQSRFLELHVKAMRWPISRVVFTGATPWSVGKWEGDKKRVDEIVMSEYLNGFLPWFEDPLGIGAVLQSKRQSRNYWDVGQGLFDTSEERRRSGVRTKTVKVGDMMQEVLLDETQPWEL
ncbi:DUF218 domain-containing protein [Calycina marina]|uniref:DUF218 domain-containing protein n=1 Tax=Calycina marina TaxID=1763456 RepID=A0A9P7Z0U4_9HELO|nr:DUF218 domain-containing protein [Calycina marina]